MQKETGGGKRMKRYVCWSCGYEERYDDNSPIKKDCPKCGAKQMRVIIR